MRTGPAVTDGLAALAFAAGRGDRDALTELIQLTQHDVQRFLTSLTAPADVEDLAQETYLRAVRARPSASSRTPLLRVGYLHATMAGRNAMAFGTVVLWRGAWVAES